MKKQSRKSLSLITYAVAALAVTCSMSASHAKEITPEDLFGRVIYVAGGSSIHHHIKPMVIKAYNRTNIEFGYVVTTNAFSRTGISFADDNDSFKASILYIMIDCVNKTYSPYPEDETNMGMIAYRSGSDFKWGDYERLGFDSHESVTGPISKLFEDACTLSEKF